ncbi:MAG: hypothetical protein IK048_00770 [Clostridia bacterium]|nr:hypothetical protein [Clostridia bacterium]
MAITLDELLGRNTQQPQETYDRFPTYEEFHSQRATARNVAQETPRYDFDVRPMEMRSEDAMRDYAASQPYAAPRSSEYQQRDYDFYQNLERKQGGYDTYVQDSYAPTYAQPAQPQNLYEFTRQDNDRLSDAELLAKLEHTDVSRRPIFDRADEAVATPQRFSLFKRNAQKAEAVQGEKKRARLNTKGKIILGAYVAVIALVAVLIIVNASKINKGKAVTPSSSMERNAIVQVDER